MPRGFKGMNFLINIDNNPLFSTGIVGLIHKAIKECNIASPFVSSDFTAENIHKADYIFMTLCPGEYFLCFKDLINRKKSVNTFIFIGSETLPARHSLPECIKEARFFSQKAGADVVYEALLNALRGVAPERESNQSPGKSVYACINCNYRALSFTQEKIARGLNSCLGMNDIADRIGITYKTAVSHKKNIMNKFNLNNKLELYEFIAQYHKRKH
jgi:DNA-binding CsgD family transcriptional regulator